MISAGKGGQGSKQSDGDSSLVLSSGESEKDDSDPESEHGKEDLVKEEQDKEQYNTDKHQ